VDQVWDLWFPGAGSTGLSFARATVSADAVRGRLLVHAAPPQLEVVVREADGGRVVATGSVLLPGGEAGVLTAWQHAEDRSWWRWSVELANSRCAPGLDRRENGRSLRAGCRPAPRRRPPGPPTRRR
jgi:hypothetical protein